MYVVKVGQANIGLKWVFVLNQSPSRYLIQFIMKRVEWRVSQISNDLIEMINPFES